ncbi:MAG: ParM/StbA family protein [Desulfobacterales bacterium]|nr:ParM/StbA family protein [Desulfobacterales bacterium]
MRRFKLIGVDLGFGFTKGFDGQRSVIVQSVLSEQGRTDDSPGTDRLGPDRGFHITADDGDFFVGDRADCDWRSARHPRQPERLFGEYGKRLILAVLADFTEMERPLHLVLGLPVSHWQRLKETFVARLVGYHQIRWLQPDGSRIPKNIHIRKIHTLPHPMGTYLGMLMDADGRIRDEALKDQKVVLVDIGFRSTNVIVMERMRLSNRCSGTIDLGVGRGLEAIDRKLRQQSGYAPRFDQLYQALRMGHIRVEGQTYNLERIRAEAFGRLAEELAARIDRMLTTEWDLDRLVLTGGGARELAEPIGPLLPGAVSLIENLQDLRLNNVQGQLHLARSRWGL